MLHLEALQTSIYRLKPTIYLLHRFTSPKRVSFQDNGRFTFGQNSKLMETQNDSNPKATASQPQQSRKKKRSLFGLVIIAIGVWWLLHRMDILNIPPWVLSWPVILMVIGLFQLVASEFKRKGGYITLGAGALFFVKQQQFLPAEFDPYFWPVVLIGVGLAVFLGRNRPSKFERKMDEWEEHKASHPNAELDNSEVLDSTVIMGGTHKDIISKNFKGGEITCIMGGAELYFGKADLQQEAIIDATVLMGGIKIIVPNNWNVNINTTNILGGVDDKRLKQLESPVEKNKSLTITGSVIMGGIDLQSY